MPVSFAPILILALAGPLAAGEPIELPDRAFGVPCLFRVYPVISEASGAALTTEKDGARFYWSLGDSGTGTSLARTDLTTLNTERVELAKRVGGQPVRNVDWESLTPDNDGNLWIVDGGANNAPRRSIVIYSLNPRDATRPLPVARSIEIAYPHDGETPAPDVEASIILNGSLFLIEKTFGGNARIFHADLSAISTNAPLAKTSARMIGLLSPRAHKDSAPVPVSAVTDASLCNGQIFLLTYQAVYRFPAADLVKAAAAAEPTAIIGQDNIEFVMPLVGRAGVVVQAEGIAALSSDAFFLSREDGRVFLWRKGRFEKPADFAATRSGSATP